MNTYGTLHKGFGRYALRFERSFTLPREEVFQDITNPSIFSLWYPFATGEMDLRIGGKIFFDDGEGSTYEGIITDLISPHTFAFHEVEDLVHISLRDENEGYTMVFTHTFDESDMVVSVAAGWHRCLDVLHQLVNKQPVEWKENAPELREYYRDAFHLN
ncbi:SRPBCC domain-containing protein [Mesobacillus maritimus]|uniref:SRPBCC domain-containing protein n=1 Tax=Mesobacillus maritimus TaxID=1643336 RepID=A0ABS7K826_9BACI|nr:SRPBCC domain-containing protein [Mesobacillus maritimus]